MADEKRKKLTEEEKKQLELDKKVQQMIDPNTEYEKTLDRKEGIDKEAKTKGMRELGKLGAAVASKEELKKYTDEDIKAIKKEQAEHKSPFSWWDGWTDIPMGIGNGVANTGYSLSDFVLRHGSGGYLKPIKAMELNPLTKKGREPSAISGVISDIVQFTIPYSIINKGKAAAVAAKEARALKGMKKPERAKLPGRSQRRMAHLTQGIVQSLPADFLAFHPHQGNMGDMLTNWWDSKTFEQKVIIQEGYPGMKSFVRVVGGKSGANQEEELSIMTDIEERFRDMGTGVIAGAAFNLLGHGLKAYRLNKYMKSKATQLQGLEVERARILGTEVTGGLIPGRLKSLNKQRDVLRKELDELAKEAENVGVKVNEGIQAYQRESNTPFTQDPSLDVLNKDGLTIETAPGLIKPKPKEMESILKRPIREEEVQPRYYGDEPTDWVETGTKKSLGKDAPDKVFRGSSHQVTINERGDLEIKPQTDDMWERNFPGEGTGTSVTSSSNEAADYALRSYDRKLRELVEIRERGEITERDFERLEEALARDNPYVIEINKEAWDRAVAGKTSPGSRDKKVEPLGTDSGEIRVVSEGSIIIKKRHWKKYSYKGEEGIYAARGAEPIGEGGLRAATKETTEEVAEEVLEAGTKKGTIGPNLFATGDKDIYLDLEAIQADWEDGMAYMKGIDKEASFSPLERAIGDNLGLDVAKLRNAFLTKVDTPEKGAEVYAKFLELRAKRIKKALDDAGFKNKVANPEDPQVFRIMNEATYDTIVKDLKISPSSVEKAGETMTRGGGVRESLVNTKFDSFLESVNPDTGRSNKDNYLQLQKDVKTGKVGARKALVKLIEDGIFNPRLLELDTTAPIDVTTTVLVETIQNLFGKKLSNKNNTNFLLDVLDVRKTEFNQKFTPEQLLDEGLNNLLKDIAGDQDPEKMLQILLSGEGVLKNSKFGPIVKDGKGVKDIASLTKSQKTQLATEMLALRLATHSRQVDLDKAVAVYLSKEDKLPQDHLAMMLAADRMVTDNAAIRHFQADWSALNLSMQERDYNRFLFNTKLSESERTQLIEKLIKTARFGGKRGKEALELTAVTISKLNKSADYDLTPGDRLRLSRLTKELIEKGSFAGYATDVWISALLSGLATSGANIVGTLGKSVTMPVTRILGSTVMRKDRASILGKMMDGPTARKYAKSQSWQQLVMMKDFARSFWRLYMRASPDDLMVEGAEQGFRNMEGAAMRGVHNVEQMDRTLRGGITGQGLGGTQLPEHYAEAGSVKALWGSVAHKTGAAARWVGGKKLQDKTYRFVDKVADAPVVSHLGDALDGLYHSTLKQGLRKLVAFDEFAKNMMAYSYVRSSLATHASLVMKLDNPKAINDFVMKMEKGMIMPNGELFSIEGLADYAQTEFHKIHGRDNPEAWESFRKEFFEKHADLKEGDVVIMSAKHREEIADKIRKEIEEATFTTKGGSVAKNYDELKAIRDNEDVKKRGLFQYGRWAEGGEELVKRPWMQLLATPFARVTGNLFKEIGTHMPFISMLGHRFRADLLSGDTDRVAAAWGRQMVGGAFIGTVWMLAKEGKIRGRGPTDPKQRKNAKELGIKPYSIVFPGGFQLEFARLDPHLAGFLTLAADIQENLYYARNEQEREFWERDVSFALAQAFGELVGQKTYLKNMDELFNLMETVDDQESFATLIKYGKQKAGSFVPNILGGITGSLDTQQRKISDTMHALQYKLWPFGIPPKRHHIFGEILDKTDHYPNPFIYAFTPVKIYKAPKDEAIEIEMVSLFSEFQSSSMYEANSPNLNWGRSHAVLRPAELEPREGEKEVPKWRKEQWRKHSKNMLFHAKNFKAPGGTACPISPGQDAYDFEQQYISVRAVPWVKPWGLRGKKNPVTKVIDEPGMIDNAEARMKKLAEQYSPDELKDHKDYQTYKAVVEWGEFLLKGGDKPMTLRQQLTAAIEHPAYKKISTEGDSILGEKSLRLTQLAKIITKFRDDSRKELIGNPVTITNHRGEQKTWDSGIISLFWKDLAIKRYLYYNQDSKRKAALPDIHTGGVLPTGKESSSRSDVERLIQEHDNK